MVGSRAPWQNPRIIFILLAIFLSGAATGAIAMKRLVSPERHRGYFTADGREISLQRFRNNLSLSPDQEREMAAILDDFMMYYQTLQAQMDDVRATGKDRIMKILNEEQKQRFLKMLDDLQARQIH